MLTIHSYRSASMLSRSQSLGLLGRGIRRYSSTSHDSLTLKLPDGRTLGYAEYGQAAGLPVLFLHGFPGSRLEAYGAAQIAKDSKVRLICPDRPGFGLSTRLPRREIIDYPVDVASLLDHLNLERAAVVGGSGGGPYALACGVTIPQRVSTLGLLASAPPWTAGLTDMPAISKITRAAVIKAPAVASALTGSVMGAIRWTMEQGPVARRIEAYLASKGTTDPAEARREITRSVMEGFAQGPDAAVHEADLLSRDWGFDLGDVKVPVHIWHGTNDARSPIRMIRWMAERIPQSTLTEYDAGHFDIHKQLGEVFGTLVKEAQR